MIMCGILTAQAQIKLTYVNPTTQEIRIKNFGGTSVDITNYRFCALFEYANLVEPSITILSGSLNLTAGSEVAVQWNAGSGFNTSASDIGLYLPTGGFNVASAMVDFMQYGAGGQGREGVANTAGLWVAGTFLTGTGPWEYTGDGSASGIALWSAESVGPNTDVRLNELDMDQPGTDTDEFIELFGDAGTSLDGLVIVLFTGATDLSYDAYDLDGYSLDANGFFVLGSATVPNVDMVLAGPIENGADAVALYAGNAADWPDGIAATSTNLVDAIIYGTDDAEDTGLIAALASGQFQLNTDGNNATSFSRVPDGGVAFDMLSYVVQGPTPGESNIPACNGGAIEVLEGVLEQCIEDDNSPFELTTSNSIGDTYVYFVTDASDAIISSYSAGTIDMDDFEVGEFHIYGLAYNGTLDPDSSAAGQNIQSVISDDCYSLSVNSVVVNRTACNVDVCEGGVITTAEGNSYISLCLDGEADVYDFSHVSGGNADMYTYFLADANGIIVQELPATGFDFNTLSAGAYYVHGLAYFTGLDVSTTEPGDALTGLSTLGTCLDLSDNNIEVQVLECALGEGCTRLFISEYFEGDSNDKALEIYNPTPFPVDLSDYDLFLYANGGVDYTAVAALSGTVQPGDVYVIANSGANASILAQADQTGNIATFNGNDAIVLTYDLEPIDAIGVVGVDPGVNGWSFGLNSTTNNVMVRDVSITAPTTDWTLSSGQWNSFAVSDYTHIGSHSAVGCGGEAFVSFEVAGIQVEENVGTIELTINAFNVTVDVPVTIDISSASATAGEDFTGSFPVTLTFTPENNVQVITIDIIDDLIEEELFEYFTLTMNDDDDLATFVNESITISIEPSDLDFPYYEIGTIITADDAGVADSVGVYCSISGIVHGINFNPDGTEFTLIDATGGIKVFDADESFGYTVVEGDSVLVLGQVAQFMGMMQFYPLSITLIDGGHPLETPTLVTELTESNESHMVRMECVELIDPTQWTQTGSGFDVDVTDGTNTFVMRVDLNTTIFPVSAPAGHFSVVGIGAQEDDALPYDSGYTFWPRYIEDISDEVVATFQMPTTIIYDLTGASVDFTNNSVGAAEYEWSFGDGTTSTSEDATHEYSYDFLNSVAEVTVTLTVQNGDGCTDVYSATVDVAFTSVSENDEISPIVYPNPTKDRITVENVMTSETLVLMDMQGRQIFEEKIMGRSRIELSLGSLSSGVYLIELRGGNGIGRTKVIKD